MAKIYQVTVKQDYRWSDCQVAGRTFSKRAVTNVAEADLTDEIRNSPLLDVTEAGDGAVTVTVETPPVEVAPVEPPADEQPKTGRRSKPDGG